MTAAAGDDDVRRMNAVGQLIEKYERLFAMNVSLVENDKPFWQLLAESDLTDRQLDNLRSRLSNWPRQRVTSAKSQDAIDWLENALKTILQTRSTSTSKVFFSPGERCLKAITGLLGHARRSVNICVFTITDSRITDAIIRAHDREVKVQIISDNDKAHDAGSDIFRLKGEGIPLRTGRTPTICITNLL